MAEKKKTEKKDVKKLDRIYIIPIRKLSIKTARWRRAKRAVSVIKKFMKRHMKSDQIKLGQKLNEVIWERGGKNVPPKLEVRALKEDGIVKVNLIGIPMPGKKEEKPKKGKPKKEVKTAEKKEEKAKEKIEEVKPVEEKKEEKPAEVKEEQPKTGEKK